MGFVYLTMVVAISGTAFIPKLTLFRNITPLDLTTSLFTVTTLIIKLPLNLRPQCPIRVCG